MANILENPTCKANLSKHGHDVSKTRKFSAVPGQLLPMYMDILYPGDKVYLGEEMIARTQDLDSAAMVDLTQHVDYFFVPLEQLYSPFGSWITGVNDIRSSLITLANIQEHFPYFRYADLAQLLDWSFGTDWTYQNLPSDMKDIFGVPRIMNILRLIQLFGLGSIWQQCFDENNNFELLRTDTSFALSSWLGFLAAYQKIYMDYYRLSDREVNDPSCYSLDRFYEVGYASVADIAKFFTMRYRPMKKDFFTSVQISPMFGPDSVSSLPQNTLQSVQQWLTGHTQWTLNLAGAEGDPQTSEGDYGSVGAPRAATGIKQFNVPNITTMFALNKMLEVTRRAGKHYDKQMLAHFGVDVPTGISGEVMYIGSHSSKIHIGDVLATADGSAPSPSGEGHSVSYVGQVGGKGYGYDSAQGIQFIAPSHGIVMAIYSVVPEVEYYPTIDRLNSYVNPYDFYSPEFDKLGMQPLFSYQGDFYQSVKNDRPRVLGWQYRYSESKLKFDDITGAFTTSLNYWTTAKYAPSDKGLDNFLVPPTYLNSVMSVNFGPYFADPSANVHDLAHDPYAEDPIFGYIRFNVKKVSTMSTYGLLSI